ncbi:tigger transposable element-derived protein 6-like [Octopus sinensis]|uniref:Tigger transposable element-derived protein 6-like n=1 Tax=Octopus sinensis TaxID=2607531 RepID=A0A6P7U5D0_9MOLL|nr:tigger transposable element-derived protein 6-like [Octopus sinensis]
MAIPKRPLHAACSRRRSVLNKERNRLKKSSRMSSDIILSFMKLTKTAQRTRLTDEHLSSLIKVGTTQIAQPDSKILNSTLTLYGRSKNWSHPISRQGPSFYYQRVGYYGRIVTNNTIEFKASRGWLEKFKLRNGIKLRKFHGDSGSVNHDEKSITDFNETMSLKIEQYGLDNVYNADETGVFYKAIPSKSVCTKSRPGIKLSKDRFSLLLCANCSGSDKRRPVMIGRFKSPRCFKNFNIGKYVTYTHSNKAWMNREIFNKWLSDFDCELAKKKRKILLVIDQCPSHQIIVTLNSIEILFLPSRTSSLLQPMDQGIIKCFKAEFTNLKINDIIEKVEAGENCQNAINGITLKTAAILTFFAWNKVTPTTIKNCFRHAQWIKCETITINSESKN